MSKSKLAVGFLVTLALGLGAGAWWAHHGMASSPTAPSANGRQVLYWHDPMVPTAKFDKPGKSPYMDMPLVPVYADAGGAWKGVSVSPAVQQNLGIRLGTVERIVLPQLLAAVGSVAFDEHQVALVQARVTGYVTRLYVKAVLDPVRRGAPIAELTAPDWLQAEDEYLALLDSKPADSTGIRNAARQRLVVLGVPDSTIEQIEKNHRVPRTTSLIAPIGGVVTELGIREGSTVMAGAPLVRINGLDRVWVNAEVPEAQVNRIPMHSTAQIRATAWPDQVFSGRVDALLPQVNPTTRSISVRLSLENRSRKLSPGMFVQVNFQGSDATPQLVIPSEALIMTGERSVVIVAGDKGRFDPVNVTVGRESDGRTVILAGLTAGQSIVLSGQFLIDSEASLTSTIDRLTAIAPEATIPSAPKSAPVTP